MKRGSKSRPNVVSEKTTAPDMHALLRNHYSGHAWAFCFEVPDGTSSNKRRTIDALAMGCWKSEGIHLHGHEIKHSRSDWLKELNDPSKQTTWLPYLHRFWVVAPSGIVKIEELPAEWGLMENSGSGLKVRKAGSFMQPKDIPHSLLAAIMRRILLSAPSATELRAERERAFEAGKRAGDLSAHYESLIAHHKNQEKKLEQVIETFESASGVNIRKWSGPHIGAQFRAFQRLESGLWDQCLQAAKSFIFAAEQLKNSGNVPEPPTK